MIVIVQSILRGPVVETSQFHDFFKISIYSEKQQPTSQVLWNYYGRKVKWKSILHQRGRPICPAHLCAAEFWEPPSPWEPPHTWQKLSFLLLFQGPCTFEVMGKNKRNSNIIFNISCVKIHYDNSSFCRRAEEPLRSPSGCYAETNGMYRNGKVFSDKKYCFSMPEKIIFSIIREKIFSLDFIQLFSMKRSNQSRKYSKLQ